MKQTICLVTDWYPTKENPFRGRFFQEQAFAVEDSFDFLVLHCRERRCFLPGRQTAVSPVNRERNTAEYDVTLYMPFWCQAADLFRDFWTQRIRHRAVEGVGKYLSPCRKRCTKKRLEKVYREHFQGGFDALYCVDAQREAYYLQYLSEASGKPYVLGEHAPVPWPGTVLRDVNKEAIEKADALLAISYDKIRQLLLLNLKLPETTYVGNLIDERTLTLRPRQEGGIRTLVTVAANSFFKNYGMFIAVMERLKQITAVPFKVLIVGYAANKGYSRNREELDAKIAASSFADCAELIPAVPHEELVQVLHRGDAYVMTSIQEGQPVSAMEAACCGLPVFSTRCGGVEDYTDDTTGRIYAVTDTEGMARGLKDYLEGRITFDPEHIRHNVVSRFGNEAFVKNFTEVFEGVIRHA